MRHVIAMKRENSQFYDASPLPAGVADFPLLDALRQRRSRRFGLGMKMPAGPLAYESKRPPRPLTEDEEAAMVFAACGITGHALADLCYAPGGGGGIMAGLVARTIASGDGLQTVALTVINDQGAWLVRRPRELPAGEIPDFIELGRRGEFTELYRRCRVKIVEGRPEDAGRTVVQYQRQPVVGPRARLDVLSASERFDLHVRERSAGNSQ